MSFSSKISRVATMATVLTISIVTYANSLPPGRLVASAGSSVSIENRSLRRATIADAQRLQNKNRLTAVLQRRERLQKVMLALDGIAQATLQLKPETASRLEPVVVDLAEQAIDLTRDDSLNAVESEQSILKLEKTVSQLLRTMSRYVEPEMLL